MKKMLIILLLLLVGFAVADLDDHSDGDFVVADTTDDKQMDDDVHEDIEGHIDEMEDEDLLKEFPEDELLPPGITPDSPFYFVDTIFDVFQTESDLADEKAAEAIVMARENHEKGLAKALAKYEKAMTKREESAEVDEELAEEVTKQAGKHLEVLARVLEKVPEQAKAGINKAMMKSAKSLDKGLDELEKNNPEKAGSVAKEILERVLEKAPEAAKKGLMNALESVQRHGKPKDNGKPREIEMPEDKGKPTK